MIIKFQIIKVHLSATTSDLKKLFIKSFVVTYKQGK